ncbi:MAG: 16S rRNA (cytidine(1402)-2'-O)-methyltransferase [Bacteroidota bacterium]
MKESEESEQPEKAPKKAPVKRKKKVDETTAQPETTAGTLYLVSTPIGNNDDITLRALNVLKQCDVVISEEAKVAAPLLHAHSISKPIEELNEHNEEDAAAQYIELLKSGKNLALMSDCGTPVLADPGLVLVRKALKENITINVVPGASSVLTALVRSGFDASQFLYAGFLKRRPEERELELRQLAGENRTVILLETPYRLKPVLEAAAKVMPGRRAYLGCNLTMPFETHHYGTFAELWEKFEGERFKGEFVIVFEKPSDRSPFKKQEAAEEGHAPLRRRPPIMMKDDEEETEDDQERMTLLDTDEIDVDVLEEEVAEDAPRPRFDRERERTKEFSRGGESRNGGRDDGRDGGRSKFSNERPREFSNDRPRESRGGFGGPRREGGGFGGGERREGGPRREGGFSGGSGPRREGGFSGGGERRPFSREGSGSGPRREGGFSGGGNREGGNYNRSGGFGREGGGGNREGGPRREGGFKREGGFSREGGSGPRREGGGGFGGGERRPFNREGGGGFKGGNSSRGGGFGGDRRRDEGGGGEDRPRRNFGDNPFSGGGAKGGFKKPFKKR